MSTLLGQDFSKPFTSIMFYPSFYFICDKRISHWLLYLYFKLNDYKNVISEFKN
jgi:hypothetical protein